MKQATSTIPIVSLNVSDHVRVGLAKSRARPGGNLTGMDVIAADLTPKLLELLKERRRVCPAWRSLGWRPARDTAF
jgi:putative tryptophan/tyrosine transport system substrate-binding protein